MVFLYLYRHGFFNRFFTLAIYRFIFYSVATWSSTINTLSLWIVIYWHNIHMHFRATSKILVIFVILNSNKFL